MTAKKKRELRVREFESGNVVHRVDVTGRSERGIEKVLLGMLRNMDTERFCIDDSALGEEPKP
jgi:hypothetical protein